MVKTMSSYFVTLVKSLYFVLVYSGEVEWAIVIYKTEKSGIEVESAADAPAVHYFHEAAVMYNAVVITESECFTFIVRKYYFVQKSAVSFHGGITVPFQVCLFIL